VESVTDFYDCLAPSYHLIYAEWRQAVRRQGQTLVNILAAHVDPAAQTVLDCSCGIGTQAIGLAEQGYTVHATDISPRSVQRARENAANMGVPLTTGVADMRTLASDVPGDFDIVLSCDNSVPHLVQDDELKAAARGMWAKLRPGGTLIVSMRDYDHMVRERPRATLPSQFDGADGRRIYFQMWDWDADGRTYLVHLFLIQEVAGHWETAEHETRYRALLRAEWGDIVRVAGFTQVRWQMPHESGYYQPVMIARKNEMN